MRMVNLAGVCIVGLLAMSASAAPINFYANLDGPSEAPPNASPGTGYAFVSFDPVAHTLLVNIIFEGLLGTTTASHIHVINGPGDTNTADTTGPVATTTPNFLGFPLGVTAGSYSRTLDTLDATSYRAGWITDSGGTTALAEAALFAGISDGRAYVNIHSSVFGGGEIRGFLQPAPEPSTMLLLSAAMGGLLLLRRKRQA